MTLHIDCTTPEKLDAFCDALLAASKTNEPVDLAKVAKTKQIITGKIDFWHGLKIGQRVVRCYQGDIFGHIEDVVVCQRGEQPPFGKLLCRWENGASTEEHPEHLAKTIKQ